MHFWNPELPETKTWQSAKLFRIPQKSIRAFVLSIQISPMRTILCLQSVAKSPRPRCGAIVGRCCVCHLRLLLLLLLVRLRSSIVPSQRHSRLLLLGRIATLLLIRTRRI